MGSCTRLWRAVGVVLRAGSRTLVVMASLNLWGVWADGLSVG